MMVCLSSLVAYALQGKLYMNAFLIAYMMDMLILVFVHAFVVVEHAFVFLLIMFVTYACMHVCVCAPHANVPNGTVSYSYTQHAYTLTVIVTSVIESELFIGVGEGGTAMLIENK